MKTLIIGCTGTVGSMVLKGLSDAGVQVRCMTHSPEKIMKFPAGVDGRFGDLEKPDTLPPVFEDIDNVFLLNAVSPSETRQGLNAVEAAIAAGVKRIVYLSVYMPEGASSIPHFGSKLPVENAIKDSPMAFTILRPNNFFQNDIRVKDAITRYGLYPMPIGSIGLNRVDVRDVSDAAVNALTQPGHDGLTYSIHGPDILTGDTVARIYSRHLGHDVRYGGDDLDAWASQARNMMQDWMVRDFRIMYKFFQDYGMLAGLRDLQKEQKIIGHGPRRFEDFVQEIVNIWKKTELRAA